MILTMLEKKCCTCKIIKKADLFYNDKGKKDGKSVICISCKNELKGKLIQKYQNITHTAKEKICSKCNVLKGVNDFNNNKTAKDGKSSYCKNCKSNIDKQYRCDNYEKIAKHNSYMWHNNESTRMANKKIIENRRCGLNATEFVKNKSCIHCGMTNDQHVARWSERLHVDHINNDGRHSESIGLKPNNHISNLQILCRSCHVKKDNKLKDYNKQSILKECDVENILNMIKKTNNIRKVAMDLGYQYRTIYAISKGRNLKRFNR